MSLQQRSRLRFSDLLALGLHGSRARPGRAVLSSLGIAIGIAAMISVIGISTSSQALVKDIPGVVSAGSTSVIDKVHIYRNSEIEASRTGGLAVASADLELLEAT